MRAEDLWILLAVVGFVVAVREECDGVFEATEFSVAK
tara:strand:+ start:1015 stop:1125 length:111 start_codon:yes stop_codon:yes gene_type:complete